MLSKRIIACLDVRNGAVVKGINFKGLRHAGDPATLAARYNCEGIDEVVILDITATIEQRKALADTIHAVAQEIFLPLCVGGGIRGEEHAEAAIEAGADKVGINTAALSHPALITTLAKRYGSQAVIVAIDAKREDDRYKIYVRSGQQGTERNAVEWAREAADRGAGEILLTSIDRDGTKRGFDCELTAAVSSAVPIPVIASGGAGTFDHFVEVFTDGQADAALAASIFHYSEHAVADLKTHLRTNGRIWSCDINLLIATCNLATTTIQNDFLLIDFIRASINFFIIKLIARGLIDNNGLNGTIFIDRIAIGIFRNVHPYR